MGRRMRPGKPTRSILQSEQIPQLGGQQHYGRVLVLQRVHAIGKQRITFSRPTTIRSYDIVNRFICLLVDCINLLILRYSIIIIVIYPVNYQLLMNKFTHISQN